MTTKQTASTDEDPEMQLKKKIASGPCLFKKDVLFWY